MEYHWTGGASGYSGKIFLDSDNSPASGGTIAEVGAASFIRTPGGIFNVSFTADTSGQAFTWNPSAITSMWIIWNQPGPTPDGNGNSRLSSISNFPGFPNGLVSNHSTGTVGDQSFADLTGSWIAVPEPLAGPMVGLGSVTFVIVRRFRCCTPSPKSTMACRVVTPSTAPNSASTSTVSTGIPLRHWAAEGRRAPTPITPGRPSRERLQLSINQVTLVPSPFPPIPFLSPEQPSPLPFSPDQALSSRAWASQA